jgi:hypothetical protein
LEDLLMAQMHPVEISDGQNWIFERSFEILGFPNNFHGSPNIIG